jgi:hypothetical protein
MDRMMLADHLAKAERHVMEGAGHIARQRELVARLDGQGLDAEEARKLLLTFEEMQDAHIADRDRLIRELSQPDK